MAAGSRSMADWELNWDASDACVPGISRATASFYVLPQILPSRLGHGGRIQQRNCRVIAQRLVCQLLGADRCTVKPRTAGLAEFVWGQCLRQKLREDVCRCHYQYGPGGTHVHSKISSIVDWQIVIPLDFDVAMMRAHRESRQIELQALSAIPIQLDRLLSAHGGRRQLQMAIDQDRSTWILGLKQQTERAGAGRSLAAKRPGSSSGDPLANSCPDSCRSTMASLCGWSTPTSMTCSEISAVDFSRSTRRTVQRLLPGRAASDPKGCTAPCAPCHSVAAAAVIPRSAIPRTAAGSGRPRRRRPWRRHPDRRRRRRNEIERRPPPHHFRPATVGSASGRSPDALQPRLVVVAVEHSRRRVDQQHRGNRCFTVAQGQWRPLASHRQHGLPQTERQRECLEVEGRRARPCRAAG